jgi:hypothetical protein
MCFSAAAVCPAPCRAFAAGVVTVNVLEGLAADAKSADGVMTSNLVEFARENLW